MLLFARPADGRTRSVELPATPLGDIVREWVEVINGGGEAAVKSFVENRFSEAALAQNAAVYPVLFRNLQRQGGIEIVRVTPNTGELPMHLIIKSKTGERFARVTVGLSKGGKLAGIGIAKTEDPAAPQWGAGELSEEETIAEIKRQIAARAKNGDFSGAVLIARGDRILLHEAHGEADREAKTPNTVKTRFHLASVGKMLTSAAIATLVRDGKISYDQTVAELLPDYPNRAVAGKVTVHQLLTHSAGFGTFFESPGFDPQRRYRSATEEIAVYRAEPLFFEPGSKWRYSNAGYSLLGAIIERVSGRTYLEYLREKLLGPLAMRETDTETFDAPALNAAVLYRPGDEDPFGLGAARADRGILRSQATGFGGGFSTTADLFKFARAYRTGKFLGQKLTTRIVTPKVNEQKGRDWGYGIVETTVNGETVRGHSGGGRANLALLWKSDYTVIVLTNLTPPSAADLSGRIVELITRQQARRNAAAK
jgi:D-alanyl-D-alanine carboxypeptidase